MKKQLHYLAHGDFVYRHDTVPIFIRAEGAYLFDNAAHKYFDAEAANGTASLGFDSSIVRQAYQKAANIPSIPSFCETHIRLRVAEKIGSKIEKILHKKGKIAFELGGAQGVELALKIVKSNTRKSQFVVFEGGYHGRSVYTSQFSASHRYRSLMGDWRIPIVRLPFPDFDQSGYSDKKRFYQDILLHVKRLAENEVGGLISKNSKNGDIAALVIEPILNAGGIVKPDKDFLEEIVRIFRQLGALIVVDEVFCGFYRTGPLFGFMHYDFVPDIIVMSKALTNGLAPLSCVWAKESLLNDKNFPPGTHSATFINNPLTLSIADTVLDRFEKWKNKSKDIKQLEENLQSSIDEILKFSKHTRNGFAIGGLGRILLKKNSAGKILELARTIGYTNPIDGVHGLILASTGMSPNVIAINPPLNSTQEDMKIFKRLLLRTFQHAEKFS